MMPAGKLKPDQYDRAVDTAIAALNDALAARLEARRASLCGCRSASHELCGSLGLPEPGSPDWPGLTQKYVVLKANGQSIDPKAFYFVLRVDTDSAAVAALRAYCAALPGDDTYRMLLKRDLEKLLAASAMPAESPEAALYQRLREFITEQRTHGPVDLRCFDRGHHFVEVEFDNAPPEQRCAWCLRLPAQAQED